MIGPLSWVLIYVKDLDKVRPFYEHALQLPLKSVRPKIVVFRTGRCTLQLMDSTLNNGPDAMDDARGWQRNKVLISFRVDDIRAAVAAVESRGAPCISGIKPTMGAPGEPPKGWIAQFIDPEGNIVEICELKE